MIKGKNRCGKTFVSECEYDLLLEYTKNALKSGVKNKEKYRNDSLIVTFMVKTAQKYYKEKFWGAFFEQLRLKADQEYKNILEKTLIYTLQKNNKYIVNKNERLNTIFFHAFICDYYSKAWFELLLGYYLDDLSGNLANHSAERYHYFLEGLLRENADGADVPSSAFNTADSYILRRAALNAMTANEQLSLIKANQALELIDHALKNKTLTVLNEERINKLFGEWAPDSYKFKKAYECPQSANAKHDPVQLQVNFADNSFALHLQSRTLAGEKKDDELFWQIKTIKRKEQVKVEKTSILSGEKSGEAEFKLNSDELFGRIKAELYRGEEKMTEVLFKGERARFFTADGIYTAHLLPGRMYAYANKEINVQSFAITKQTALAKLAVYQLDCAQDDIVIIDNYEIRALGAAGLNEGLSERGKIADLTAFDENNRPLAVYGALPVLAITLQANKINASSVIINSSRYNLRSCRMLEFEKPDAKGVKIVLVDLREMPSFKDGKINRVSVDIINSSSLKSYSFVYCQDLKLSYPEAKPLMSNTECKVEIQYQQAFKIKNKNVRQNEPGLYAFELLEGVNELSWTLVQEKMDFSLKLMPVAYSFDEERWQYSLPKNILAENLPETLYIKNINSPTIRIDLAERFNWEYQAEDGIFVCDLKPLSAALNYIEDYADMDLILDNKRYELMCICRRNYVKEAVLACDYKKNQLIFKCNTLKEEPLFVDIYSKREIICTKQRLERGEVQAKSFNLTEDFYVSVYVSTGDAGYQRIFNEKMRPFDRQDITDSYVLLEGYSDTLQDESIAFSKEYVLYNIEMLDEGLYQAAMAKKFGSVYVPWLGKVEAEFYFDSLLSKCHLTFYQEEDEAYNDFLVDLKTKELLTAEDDNLSSEEKYSRYKMMFDGECVYYTKVLPPDAHLKNAALASVIGLSELGFTADETAVFNELGCQYLAEVDLEKLADNLKGKLLEEKLTKKIQLLRRSC